MIIRIGKKKTMKQKHRDRLVSIFYENNDLPISRTIEPGNIAEEFEKYTPRYEVRTPKETLRKGVVPQRLPPNDPKKTEEYTSLKHFLLLRKDTWREDKEAIENIPSEEERNTKMRELQNRYSKQEKRI